MSSTNLKASHHHDFISVIIPSHNRAKTLAITIDSILAIDYPRDRFELIVVDNCSTDDTRARVEAAKERSGGAVRYLFEPRPGVHFARNAAINYASGDWLYYTDDDMVVDKSVFRAFQALLKLDDRIVVATGQVLPIWEVEPPAWVTRIMQNSLLSLQLKEDLIAVSPVDPGVYSCHQLVRKDVLIQCGGFDPENTGGYWVGDGETGLNLRISEAGHLFGYTSEAKAFHMIPPERTTQRWLNKRLMNQGRADVFTNFRRARANRMELRHLQIKSLASAVRSVFGAFLRWMKGGDGWRLTLAKVYYFYAQSRFLGRLSKDAVFRKYVLKDSYLDD